ncbi:YsnF/AvaK domain-containing protein [Anaeromyxobacter diazotrophicus]|uniref:DUF2382 domain-containing protein n=1 Tax=Anaeromyxobacter diazotrophicus TaxID=2590199 RepID=A0A7I9VKQ6_9BACT|nr:YsnF/AvaK domain-containing protein [Anaeromyxobacter diazotrophicus]GEJ56699.1 hypothetical protein AMYX_14400 [Anaeromyxobacter diazotrophicus]
MIERGLIREGMTVHSAEGDKLGKVIACDASTFVIEKGFFFPKDYVARFEDVADVQGDDIHLLRGREALGEAGTARREGTFSEGSSVMGPGGGIETSAAEPGIPAERARSTAGRQEELRVPIAEEELDVAKRVKDAGEVRLRKDVVTETKHVDVPVTREEVHVERVPTGEARAVGPGEASFQEQTVSMPIREEELEVRKRPVVKEEVRLRKDRVVEQRAADAEVRREEVRVEGEGARGEDVRKHLDVEEGSPASFGEDSGALEPTRREPEE